MQHLRLSQLNQLIRDTLNSQLNPSYWVVAEIGEMRINFKGHCYMELVEKEEDEVLAKIRANIWAYSFRTISAWFASMTGQDLAEGMNILAQVKVDFHPLYGLSVTIKEIDPQYTLGERAKKRQQVIQRLKSEGVFDLNKQLSLPQVPQRVAIISSPTAAGYDDFMQQIKQSRYGYQVFTRLYKASMQGKEAVPSIIEAMHQIFEQAEDFDALVIIRGGGAQLDLDCFDHYELTAHVAQFPLPVLTGIGHERDESICDLVAHTHLKTPTAVAEFILDGFANFEENLLFTYEKIRHLGQKTLNSSRERLDFWQSQMRLLARELWGKNQHILEKQEYGIVNQSKHRIQLESKQVEQQQRQWTKLAWNCLKDTELRLEQMEKRVQVQSPERQLKKGYFIIRKEGKSIHLQSSEVGDRLNIEGQSVQLDAEVISIKKPWQKK